MDYKSAGRSSPANQEEAMAILVKKKPQGVLTSDEMKRRLAQDIDEPSSLVVTPLLEEKSAFDIDSIDLRLGTHFLFPRVPPRAYYCPDEDSRQSLHMRVHVPLGDFLVIPPHHTVLGATLEFIKLPFDVAGEILTKSSVARTFTLIETAPWIHPNYRGCLTLEIANVSNTAMLLYPGRRIGQMILMHVAIPESEGKRTASLLDSTYFGPVYPEAPPFKNPEVDLFRIGVPTVKVMVGPVPKKAKDKQTGHR
jgi:dCTP deaminase